MGSIRLDTFAGIRPAISSRKLDARHAQVAHNTYLRDAALRSFREPLPVELHQKFGTGSTRTLYRVPDNEDCCGGLLAFDSCVSVVETVDPGDCPGFRGVVVFPEDSDEPPYRYFACEKQTYPLVVPAPERAPSIRRLVASPSLADADYAGPDERVYVYTWVDQFGVESPPSPPSRIQQGYDDETWAVENFGPPPAHACFVRIYRAASNFENGEDSRVSFATTFQLVEEVDIGENSSGVPEPYVDDKSLLDMEHGTMLTHVDCAPPERMTQVVVTEAGYCVGFYRNNIFFSERYEPHNWQEKYRVELPERIIGLVAHFDTVFIATTGRPYRMNVAFTAHGDHADATIDPVPFTENYPCLSRHAFVGTSFGAVYSSVDGLVCLKATGPAQLVSKDRVMERDWIKYAPNVAAWHKNKYIGVNYPSGRGFIMDLTDRVEGKPDLGDMVTISFNARAIHSSREGRLYFTDGQQAESAWDEGLKPLPYVWKSKVFVLQGSVAFRAAKVVADYGAPVTLKLFADGRLYSETEVCDCIPFRLPIAGRGVEWVMQLESTSTVHEVHIATSKAELTDHPGAN